MDDRTTLQLPRPLLAKLRRARAPGQTYAHLLEEALVALNARRRFVNEQVRRAQAVLDGKEAYMVLDEKGGLKRPQSRQ
jgi:hypothetical protein